MSGSYPLTNKNRGRIELLYRLTMNSFLFKIVNNDTNVFMVCKIREETLSHLPW